MKKYRLKPWIPLDKLDWGYLSQNPSPGAIEYNHLILPRYVKAVSHHKTSEGVPLDCDGEIIFGNDSSDPFCKQIFKFDCSFLLPIRQTYEISLTNNKGYCDKVIKGNHFVLPRCPSESKFEIESSFVGYGDNATRNLNNIECISETLSISQEVEMFNTFSDKILTNDEIETLNMVNNSDLEDNLKCGDYQKHYVGFKIKS